MSTDQRTRKAWEFHLQTVSGLMGALAMPFLAWGALTLNSLDKSVAVQAVKLEILQASFSLATTSRYTASEAERDKKYILERIERLETTTGGLIASIKELEKR